MGRKILSTAKNATSNLSKHLASQPKNTDMTTAAMTSSFTRQSLNATSPAKQGKRDLTATGLSVAELKKKLFAGYIIEDMLPFSSVD